MIHYLLPVTGLVVAVAVCSLVERARPVRWPLPSSEVTFDAVYGVCNVVIVAALLPAAAFLAALAARKLGAAAFIVLPKAGPLVLLSFVVYLLTRDFLEYATHRAQHAVPVLWAMHSLHHSEESYNFLTGFRHFWAEGALKALLVYPLLAVLFDVPLIFPAIAGVVYFTNHLSAHLNARIQLGRFTLWFMNPQYHRLHHSIHPEHFNKNFADLFPFWDILFGTAVAPRAGEFPETGLCGEKPRSVLEGLLWPIRGLARNRESVNFIR